MKKIILAAVAVLALAGCGEAPAMDSTELVCDEFAAHAKAGLPEAERTSVVESMGEIIGNADQRVKDAYPGLQNSADEPGEAYQTAADTFAQACMDAGWEG